MMHESYSHGAGNAWTIEPTRRYFKRCGACHTFRLWASYYEVYYVDSDSEETYWWWECTRCLIKTISDYTEVYDHDAEVAEWEKHSDVLGISDDEDNSICGETWDCPGHKHICGRFRRLMVKGICLGNHNTLCPLSEQEQEEMGGSDD